jgi:DNA-binding transcriptional regulator YiaG
MTVKTKRPKPMTKTAYRNAIDAIGLSQVKASDFFEVSRKTSPRWARGEAPIPGSVKKLLAVMIHHELTPEEVTQLE